MNPKRIPKKGKANQRKLLETRTVQIALKKHYNLKESANLFHPKLIFYRGGSKMWKDSIRNIVVIFQTTILRIARFYVRCSAHFFAISFHKLFLASLPPLVTQTPPIFYFFVVHVQCTYYVRHSVLRTIFEEQEQDTIPLRAAGTYEGGHEDWSPPCFQG